MQVSPGVFVGISVVVPAEYSWNVEEKGWEHLLYYCIRKLYWKMSIPVHCVSRKRLVPSSIFSTLSGFRDHLLGFLHQDSLLGLMKPEIHIGYLRELRDVVFVLDLTV